MEVEVEVEVMGIESGRFVEKIEGLKCRVASCEIIRVGKQ